MRPHPLAGRALVTGRMLSTGRGLPEPGAVLIEDGQVVAVGPAAGSAAGAARRVRLAPDEVALAGFADPHLHLLSTAAAELSVDCSARLAPTIADVLTLLSRAAVGTEPGGWVRGAGFDDALVAERRHPTAAELDHAAPDHPVVLHHATGHAAVLNGRALRTLRAPTGSDGLLVRRHDVFSAVPRLDRAELGAAVERVGRRMWDAGVVAFTDATHTNGPADVEHLAALADRVPQRVSVMVGCDRLAGLRFGEHTGGARFGGRVGERTGGVRVGHAKVLAVGGPETEVREAVATAHAAGFPVAVHAADVDELARAIDALGCSPAPEGTRDRVEHCSLAFPEQVEQLARLGVQVTTQPSFLHHRGPKYLRELTELELSWLWRLRSLVSAGIPVRLSSDSPVVPARPLEWLDAAVARPVGEPSENLDRDTALGLAAAGPIHPGDPLVVVGRDSVRHLTHAGCFDA